jgi:hypothetical protein
MQARTIRFAAIAVSLAALLLATNGCAVYFADEFIEHDLHAASLPARVVRADQAVLAWDPPAEDVEQYELYYRLHGESDWVLLDTVPASPNPQYTISYEDFGDGEFEFGVVSVRGTAESAMHTSLDSSADPRTGWYLRWQR